MVVLANCIDKIGTMRELEFSHRKPLCIQFLGNFFSSPYQNPWRSPYEKPKYPKIFTFHSFYEELFQTCKTSAPKYRTKQMLVASVQFSFRTNSPLSIWPSCSCCQDWRTHLKISNADWQLRHRCGKLKNDQDGWCRIQAVRNEWIVWVSTLFCTVCCPLHFCLSKYGWFHLSILL